MNRRPGAVLAEALLPWGGTAFAAARRRPGTRASTAAAAAGSGVPSRPAGHARPRTAQTPGLLPWLRPLARACPAVSVAAAAGLLAAAALVIQLPVIGHGTGTAGPTPTAGSVRSACDSERR
ncbi:hypothetical protein [Streptomyces alanosinicus]|uniref:Uncharacterized protein n=1 Tax=Streptomyces alanosinicus TaxID=68171 RepID=A0A918YIF7_9ACTN|nr:hypothetical protein [Streptomyces alanosinicus]GHE04941.1 hypothetical protein GCM10010339_38570 [Streptomyces alanosinicus]